MHGPHLIGPLLLLLVLGIPGVILVTILSFQRRRLLRQPWEVLAVGEHDRTEYGYKVVSARHGTMVHHTSYRKMDVTAVYLTDGRSFIMNGRHSMPFPHGARVKILRHPWHGHKIVGADEAAPGGAP